MDIYIYLDIDILLVLFLWRTLMQCSSVENVVIIKQPLAVGSFMLHRPTLLGVILSRSSLHQVTERVGL